MVHWWKEWQTTPGLCHENPVKCMNKQKGTTAKDEAHRLDGVQDAAGEEQQQLLKAAPETVIGWPKVAAALGCGCVW